MLRLKIFMCKTQYRHEAFNSIFVKGEMQKLAAEYVSLITLVVAIVCLS